MWGYLLIAGLLVLFALWGGARSQNSSVSVSEFWQEKEKELGEKKNSLGVFSLNLGGHPCFLATSDGLLFLMSGSLWFENFEKGPNILGITPSLKKVIFGIPLSQIQEVGVSPRKRIVKKMLGGSCGGVAVYPVAPFIWLLNTRMKEGEKTLLF